MASLGGHCLLLVLPRHSSLRLHFVPLCLLLGLLQYPFHPSLVATRRKHQHYFPMQLLPLQLSPYLLLSPLLLRLRQQAAGAPFPSLVLSPVVRQTVLPEALARSGMPRNSLPLLLGCLCHSPQIPQPNQPNLFLTGNAPFPSLLLIVQPVHLAHRRLLTQPTRVQARCPWQRTTNTVIVPKVSPVGDHYRPLHSTVPLASLPLFRPQLAFLANALGHFLILPRQ
jgi:hypothetical protein